MRSGWKLVAVLAASFATGCADRFRTTAPASSDTAAPVPVPGASVIRVSPPPPDLVWVSDALRLFSDTHPGMTVQVVRASFHSVTGQSRFAASVTGANNHPAPRRQSPGGADSDLQFISLPLTHEQAAGLAVAPARVVTAVAPMLLPEALRAGQKEGRTLAVPIGVRWLALAWNPARLADSPAPVPPYLEAWVDQLRGLRRRQPAHAPLAVAWAEKDIVGSFALLLAVHGGRLLDETGQPAFTSPEGEATLRLMLRMLKEGLVQPTALETGTERLVGSFTGPFAYWLCPSEVLMATSPAVERLDDLRLGGLPVARALYQYPETTVAALVQYRGVAVRSNSPRAAEAWRLARFLADPVLLRGSPMGSSILAQPPVVDTPLMRQAHALVTQPGAVSWPEPPGLNEALGRFLHAALRQILTPREALERAALQFRQPGELPEAEEDSAGAGSGGTGQVGGLGLEASPHAKSTYPLGPPGAPSSAGSGYVGPATSEAGTGSFAPVPPAVGAGNATGTDASPGITSPSAPDLRSAPEVR